MTGITSLVSDPTFCRAGLFVTPPGGWQRMHEDFRLHPHTNLWNRVIMLLYCSEWDPAWGGELELWPPDMAEVGARIEPRRGRMVIFEATRSHRHGIRVIEPHASRASCSRVATTPPSPPNETPSPRILTWSRRPNERLRDVLPTVSEVLRELPGASGANGVGPVGRGRPVATLGLVSSLTLGADIGSTSLTTREELGDVDRLRDVRGGAVGKQALDLPVGRVRAEHDDRQRGGRRIAAQRLQHLVAVDVGKVEIEEHESQLRRDGRDRGRNRPPHRRHHPHIRAPRRRAR